MSSKLEQCLNLSLNIYAHNKGKEKELLQDHIELCKKYFDKIWTEKNIKLSLHTIWDSLVPDLTKEEIDFLDCAFFNTIIFHDVGKANPLFQLNIMEHPSECWKEWCSLEQGTSHSLLSSVFYLDFFYKKLSENSIEKERVKYFRYILWLNSYVISRHHSDLNDVEEYLNKFKEYGEVEYIINSLKDNVHPYYKGLFFFAKVAPKKTLKKLELVRNNLSNEQTIFQFFYIRLLYSILVCCDYYATSEYDNGVGIQSFGDIIDGKAYYEIFSKTNVNQTIRKYEKEKRSNIQSKSMIDDINILRSELFLQAEEELNIHSSENIYFLEAPTGSGKSNTAMNLSLKFLQDDKKKLFYIYPFNALVEQNKKTLSEIFKNSSIDNQIVVLNSLYPVHKTEKNKEDKNYYEKILLDKEFLNYPFILTTHVRLFQTLFSNRKEDVFSFYQLSNSVLVFDEIQSYRNEIWTEIIVYLKVLAGIMNCKIIIMSATFPNLDILSEEYSESIKLIQNRDYFFKHPLFKNRVNISYELLEHEFDLEILKSHIEKQSKKHNKILVEFIVKKTAKQFYQMMKDRGDVLLITGDDNLYEREEIIHKIRMNKIEKVILISTQVVEAGVDIDMDIGYKDISILDSDEQFMGRINRSSKNQGIVYFFSYDDAKFLYKKDVRVLESLTLKNEKMKEILKEKDFHLYYEEVLQKIREKNKKNNENGIQEFYGLNKNLKLKQISFYMCLIQENMWKKSICFCRKLNIKGEEWDGEKLWIDYKKLLLNYEIKYSERMVKLMDIRAKLQYFIYDVPMNIDLPYDDQIGELLCIKDGEQYFENGKLRDDIYDETYVSII